ncbi:hypothetical protein PR202_gb05422 [Eleusine coracana subsp. coracana]|uniref:Uncharacterized protein n=1 Tax=Eleusine coracana subsp. coracana TaxID=191504 RepID=A0AAV5E760_ELECO|nr:hypothetical protein PR202_gb05422 [Eleusine coracana subsp. coracana]
MLISLTVTFETHAFVLSRPSPPMLIPWPGPQFTLCILMLLHPVWIEMQSSPTLRQRCHVAYFMLPWINCRSRQNSSTLYNDFFPVYLNYELFFSLKCRVYRTERQVFS